MNRLVVLCFLALSAFPAVAQTTVELLPPAPTSADFIRLRVISPGIGTDYDLDQHGRHFIIRTVDPCPLIATCVGVGSPVVDLGMLSPGTYTYDVQVDGVSALTGSFVVANAGIPDAPTLSPAALLALCLILVGAGSFMIGRRT